MESKKFTSRMFEQVCLCFYDGVSMYLCFMSMYVHDHDLVNFLFLFRLLIRNLKIMCTKDCLFIPYSVLKAVSKHKM